MSDWPLLRNSRAEEDDIGGGTATYEVDNTTGGVAHTKTGWVQVVASMPRTTSFLALMTHTSSVGYKLTDIGIGGAGSEIVVVPNISINTTLTGNGLLYHLIPLFLKAGTRVAVRSQAGATGQFVKHKMMFIADSFIGLQPITRWEDWGTNLGASQGTTVTSSASANTKGAWTQLIASSAFTTKWLLFMISATGTPRDFLVDIGVGGAGSEVVVLPDLRWTNELLGLTVLLPISIPAGSRVSARAQSQTGSSQTFISVLGGA